MTLETKPGHRVPLQLAPGEGRHYDMGRIQAIFKADGTETAGKYSISEWLWEVSRTISRTGVRYVPGC